MTFFRKKKKEEQNEKVKIEVKEPVKESITPEPIPNQVCKPAEAVVPVAIDDALLTRSLKRNFVWYITMASLGGFCILTTALFSPVFIFPSMICFLFAIIFSQQYNTCIIRKEIRNK